MLMSETGLFLLLNNAITLRCYHVTHLQCICIVRYMLWTDVSCPSEAGVLLKWLNRLSWFSAKRLSLPCYHLIWVSLKIRVFCLEPVAIGHCQLQVLSSQCDLHMFITLSVHLCVQHIGCDAKRRAVCLWWPRLFFTFRLLSTECGITGECGRLSTAVQTVESTEHDCHDTECHRVSWRQSCSTSGISRWVWSLTAEPDQRGS